MIIMCLKIQKLSMVLRKSQPSAFKVDLKKGADSAPLRKE